MGSVSSKNLQEVTVAEVQVHVAGLGEDYRAYVPAIGNAGLDGEVLYGIKDKKEFKEMLKEFGITSIALTIKLVAEWQAARTDQAKRQKLMDEKNQTTVKLTNGDLFFPLSEMPKEQPEDGLKPFIGQAWLGTTLNLLLDHKDRDDKQNKRPLPLALVRCSRGGKTRAIKELMLRIPPKRAKGIYISFNNETPICLQEYFKDPVQEFYDRIGFAAQRGRLSWSDFRDTYHVDSKSIKDWLGETDCILFVDELNLLTSVSAELTKVLKTHFLVSKGRVFCFSSHLATTSPALKEFTPNPSNRETILQQLPLISSLREARENLGYPKMSAREALYFGLIPGLLVERADNQTVTNRRAYAVRTYIAQMDLKGETDAHEAFRDLLGSFITGSVSSIPEVLQELMTAEQRVNDVVLHWIPCHLEFLLREMFDHCKVLRNRACLKFIYEGLWTYLGSKQESGDAFEALFIVVAMIRCLSGTFESTILPLKCEVEDLVVKCDEPFLGHNLNTEKDPEGFVASIPKELPEEDQGCDQVSIYYPGHAKFGAYDVIVAFWKRGGGRTLYGYQLKEGASGGKPFAYNDLFAASYLIRGEPAKETSIRLFKACDVEQLDNFFGISGSQWTPRSWKALEKES